MALNTAIIGKDRYYNNYNQKTFLIVCIIGSDL